MNPQDGRIGNHRGLIRRFPDEEYIPDSVMMATMHLLRWRTANTET